MDYRCALQAPAFSKTPFGFLIASATPTCTTFFPANRSFFSTSMSTAKIATSASLMSLEDSSFSIPPPFAELVFCVICVPVTVSAAPPMFMIPPPSPLVLLVIVLLVTFVVVATANHYLTDVFLGALTAGVSALLAQRLLARARPDVWAFVRVAA